MKADAKRTMGARAKKATQEAQEQMKRTRNEQHSQQRVLRARK